MIGSMRGVVIAAALLAAAVSCGDDDDASRTEEITAEVWIDQVARSSVPEFCTDPQRESELPDLLTEQYDVAIADLDAVAEQLLLRCDAAG